MFCSSMQRHLAPLPILLLVDVEAGAADAPLRTPHKDYTRECGNARIVVSFLSRALFLLLIVISAVPAAAEDPAGVPYFEKIEVRVINVDVVVTDRSGNPIRGLTAADFELSVGGRPTPISNFLEVRGGRLEADAQLQQETGGPEAGEQETAPPPLTWAVYVDHRVLRPARRNHALQQFASFLKNEMPETDQGVISTFDGARFRLRSSSGQPRESFLRTLESIRRENVSPRPVETRRAMIIADIARAAPNDLYEAQRLAFEIEVQMEEERQSTKAALDALASFLDVLSGFDGRVALIVLGGGFNTAPGLDLAEMWHHKFPAFSTSPWAPRPELEATGLSTQMGSVMKRISSTRITLYSIFTGDRHGGLPDVEETWVDLSAPAKGEHGQLTSIGTARWFAEHSGGRFFHSTMQLERRLGVLRDDLHHYYSLGYVATAPRGRELRVRVRVAIDGALVRHRESIRERTVEEEAQDSVVAALYEGRGENPLDVVIETDAPRSAGRQRLVPILIRVPISSLTFLRVDEARQGGLLFHFALGSSDGTIWRIAGRSLPVEIPDADLVTALQQSLTYSVEIPLAARDLRLAIAVQDEIGGVRSLLVVPLGE
jgi:VWFA-related protein